MKNSVPETGCPSPDTALAIECGLRRSRLSGVFFGMYNMPKCRRISLTAVARLEGGAFFSYTLRKILWEFHGVFAGAYSYGHWIHPGAMPRGLVIGRYVSMAPNVKVFVRNHPHERLSMHPFFYNSHLGYVECDTIDKTSCWIGHDAWIGESAIVTPGCDRIGIGAVVGAGAVVTRDVPDFAIVAGNPAKIIRYRFDENLQDQLLASRWWERDLEGLLPHMDMLTVPLAAVPSNHALFKPGKNENQWKDTPAG